MRILIAHANEAARSKLADVVTRGRRISLDVVLAGDGPGALELMLADDPPEVALIDWDLPGVEAPEICRLVRDFRRRRDTWIIVMAAREHQESASEVWRAGANDCVYTPAPARFLSDRVTKGLCEMTPTTGEPSDERAASAAADPVPESPTATLAAVAQADDVADVRPAFRAERPSLDAVCRRDDDDGEGFACLTADLKATGDPGDSKGRANLAAGPVLLSAQRVDPDEADGGPRGPVTLDAVLARL